MRASPHLSTLLWRYVHVSGCRGAWECVVGCGHVVSMWLATFRVRVVRVNDGALNVCVCIFSCGNCVQL